MFALVLECTHEARDLLIADLWEAGVAGITETPEGLRAFFEDEADRAALQTQFGGAIEETEERDWVAESHEYLQPMRVGARFFLVPEWRDDPAPEDRIRIRVNSGLAFGTGAHESTRLCLEALEELIKPAMTVVDIGTGSGILAEAAKRLGAGRLIACDIDPLAIDVARENFATAGLEIELFEGSVQKVESGIADLAIGNLSPAWLALLAPDFARIIKPDGTILLSGLEASDVERVQERLEAAGLKIVETREENQWRALILRARA
jgi:ribosomal protein L11 methyltransferase